MTLIEGKMKTLVSFSGKRELLFELENKELFFGSLEGNILHIWDIIDDPTLAYIFEKFNNLKYAFIDSSAYKLDLDVDIYAVDS